MKRGLIAVKNPAPIDYQIKAQIFKVLAVLGLVQLIAMAIASGVLSYRDARNRALFLANSNEDSLGLMLSSGDMYGLRSQVRSFKSEDTPFVWIINKHNEDITATDQKALRTNPVIEDGTLIWKEDGLFLKTAFPIVYHDNFLGTLISLNRLKFFDSLALSMVFIFVMSAMFLVQSRSLEKFALRLASGIEGLSQYFSHASAISDLEGFQKNRHPTSFSEVEDIAKQTHQMLSKILQASEVEREREKYKAIAQVSAHVAHDLRYPVTVFASMQNVKTWDDFVLLRDELPGALQRIENMIDGLKKSDTEILIRLSPGRLVPLELVSAVRPAAKDKSVLVRCEGNAQDLELSMDEGKLPRVFYNLLFNAIESGASEVVLRSNSTEEDYLIEVSDNGPGVPDHFISKLFSVGSTFGKQSGSGLGLAFCKKVIEGHGGVIRYDRKDNETTFSIKLKKFNFRSFPAGAAPPKDEKRMDKDKRLSPCQVYVHILPAQMQAEVERQLNLKGVQVTENEEDLGSADLIFSNQDSVIHAALTKGISILHFSPDSSAEMAVSAIYKRYELMEYARKIRGSHEG